MKLLNVSLSSSLYEESFGSSREIQEIEIKGRDKPYFQRIKKSPLSFNLNFAFTETWDDDLIYNIKSWLLQDYYKPMVFSDNPEIIYYCVCVSEPKIIHNGLKQGYCSLEFRCDSSYKYSPQYVYSYDLSANSVDGTIITINNLGHENCFPILQITKVGDGSSEADVSIVNLSNAGIETKFTTAKKANGTLTFTGGAKDGEKVIIGSDVYEFDINNIITSGNIKVDISTGTKTQASSILTLTTPIKDGEIITIGSTVFEVDSNNSVTSGRTAIDVSSYATASTGVLTFIGIPIDGELITIGNDTYEFDTNASVVSGNIRVDISGVNGASIDAVITQLASIINANKKEKIIATGSTVNDTVTITSTIPGTIGNLVSTYKTTTGASWANDTLVNGADCSVSNAITAIKAEIDAHITANFTATPISNVITITAKSSGSYSGSKANILTTSTTCTGASFNSTTFIGGLDCTSIQAANALNTVINASATETISSTNATASKVVITYDTTGILGQISILTDCDNADWDNSTLLGGDGIIDGEIIIIDCGRKDITSSIFNMYRYSTFNNNWLYLVPGNNRLLIKGDAVIDFKVEFKYR